MCAFSRGRNSASITSIDVVRMSVYLPRNARVQFKAMQLGEIQPLSQGEIDARTGGQKVRGRLAVGMLAPASVYLEAPAPFGAPLFVFAAATDDDATLFAFHTIVFFESVDTSRAPSSLKSTFSTQFECSFNSCLFRPVARSHRMTTLSFEQVAARSPARVTATVLIGCWWPVMA